MIVLFTDFGGSDLYVGQVKAVLTRMAPGVTVIDLLHDAPSFQKRAGAHLLAALARQFPAGSVFLAVVDPGVGGPRQPVVVEADGGYFVGPDNGLLSVLAARAAGYRCWRIGWQPGSLSPSFHGRDLFAPIAAALSGAAFPHEKLIPIEQLDVRLGADDLPEIIYLDHYGNAMTGLRAGTLAQDAKLLVNGQILEFAHTFSRAKERSVFWYENSIGLIEIAVNCGSAAGLLGLAVGQAVHVQPA